MQYRRLFIPGSTVFFTLVTYKRFPVFSNDEAVSIFRESIQKVCAHHPFTIIAAVVLPDHIHMLWTLPENDTDYPMRWRLIKSDFSHRWQDPFSTLISDSRKAKSERTVWQRHQQLWASRRLFHHHWGRNACVLIFIKQHDRSRHSRWFSKSGVWVE